MSFKRDMEKKKYEITEVFLYCINSKVEENEIIERIVDDGKIHDDEEKIYEILNDKFNLYLRWTTHFMIPHFPVEIPVLEDPYLQREVVKIGLETNK